MKQKLLILFFAIVTAFTASALISFDGETFSVDYDDEVSFIYGINDETSVTVVTATPNSSGAVIIPESVTHEGKTYKVTAIGNSAFFWNEMLNYVSIPNTVESISGSAFEGCQNLTNIILPNSVKYVDMWAFRSSGLNSVVLSESLEIISKEAFAACRLKKLTIPNSVKTIGEEAFCGNGALTSVSFGNSLTEIGNFAFYETGLLTINIPESLQTLGVGAFAETQINSVIIPENITEIPALLFNGCNSLAYLKLGSNFEKINDDAFTSTPVIEISATTPPTLSKRAFSDEELAQITVIVPSVEFETAYRKASKWSDMTFTNPANVADVTVETPGKLSYDMLMQCEVMPSKVVSLKIKGAINESDYEQMRINMKALLHLDLSEADITEIPNGALSEKIVLQTLKLPTKAKTIGANAFDYCVNLNDVVFPGGLTTIGERAFYNCQLLPKLELPASLTKIGNNAFEGCASLDGTLELPGALAEIGDGAFLSTRYTAISLPRSLKSIGDNAFAGLPLDMNLRLPENLTKIGYGAFENTGLKGMLDFPDAVKELGGRAFAGTKISNVFMPRSVSTLPEELFSDCTNLDVVDVPNNVNKIEGRVFSNCLGLVNLRLPSYATELGEYALTNTPIDYMTIPNGIETLTTGVMKSCGKLVSLTLPATLKNLESDAMNGCRKLRNLTVKAIEPPVVANASVLRGVNTDKCLISIPTVSFEGYLLAPYWGQFVQVRNDIAVESEGDGTVTYEAEEEEEENGGGEEPTPTRVSRRVAMHRAGSATTADNGSSVFIPKGEKVWFYFTPGEGESLVSATLDGVDITDKIVNGAYLATADKKNARLLVKFTGESSVIDSACDFDTEASGDVYNMQGVCLKHNATEADVKALTPGLYIVGGKKVLVK